MATLGLGAGTLSGTTSLATDPDGRAAFTDLGIDGAPGTYTIEFTATGFTSVESALIELSLAASRTTILADEPDPSLVGEVVTVSSRSRPMPAPRRAASPSPATAASPAPRRPPTARAPSHFWRRAPSRSPLPMVETPPSCQPSDPKPHAVTEPAPPPVGVGAAGSSPSAGPGA
jgi:hypothetical protein